MMWNGEGLMVEPSGLVLGVWYQRAASESVCSGSFGCCSEPYPAVVLDPTATMLSHIIARSVSPPDYSTPLSPLLDLHSPTAISDSS